MLFGKAKGRPKKSLRVPLPFAERLDNDTAPLLEETLRQAIPQADVLVLDFAPLNYISSAGLRVLLAAQKELKAKDGELVLENVSDIMLEVFKVTGFDKVITLTYTGGKEGRE